MLIFPNAKINIGLNIVGKRSDGFHNIETLFCPVGLCDILEITPAEGTGKSDSRFNTTGLAVDSPPGENLCMKSYNEMSKIFSLPGLNIHLHKLIPSGAGLGGGSSDAAFTIMGLNSLFDLRMDSAAMQKLAGKTGSDTPFFIVNKPAFATGTGNVFSETKLKLEKYHIVIVHPGIKIETAWAYSQIKPKKPHYSLKDLAELPPERWQGRIVNDFEEIVFREYPLIETIKKTLIEKGAVYASMSGSGSACYGLFENRSEDIIRDSLEKCFLWEGKVKKITNYNLCR